MAEFRQATSGAIVAEALVLNLTPPSKIGTGICFLDHMVDQFTSHGMLGVTLRCGVVGKSAGDAAAAEPEAAGGTKFFAPLKDYATGLSGRPYDRDIFAACGTALGLALRRVVDEVAAGLPADAAPGSSAAVFCSPLDESFAEASVDLRPPAENTGRCVTALEPYGLHCGSATGRRWIGRYRTEHTPVFWESLATALGGDISLKKIRGGNAHHQLESTFKAFARAFRAALDCMVDPTGSHGCAAAGAGPLALAPEPPTEPRRAERRRATKETTIEVRIDLDAPWAAEDEPTGAETVWTEGTKIPSQIIASVEKTQRIKTGIDVLDRVLTQFSQAAGIEIVVHCEGDRHIDDHHTAEDVAITLGQCFYEALGEKKGCQRMGCAEGAHGGSRVRAVLDLSNRPHFESNLPLDEENVGAVEYEFDGVQPADGDAPSPWDALCGNVLSCEMLFHVYNSLTLEMRSSCHLELIEDSGATGHTLDLALAAANAYGAAVSRAIRVDPRRQGKVASSKGTLSK